jgi:hypothetical protein
MATNRPYEQQTDPKRVGQKQEQFDKDQRKFREDEQGMDQFREGRQPQEGEQGVGRDPAEDIIRSDEEDLVGESEVPGQEREKAL